MENLVIRRSATHTSSVCGVCKSTGWLSFCHGSEGRRSREELRAIILPKERLIYANKGERGRRTSAKSTLSTQRYTMDSTAKECPIQSQKYCCVLPQTLGDCSTSVLEIEKENATIRHAPAFPIMAISTY